MNERMRHIIPLARKTGLKYDVTHQQKKLHPCLSTGSVGRVSTSLCSAPIASGTVHCTLAEQHSSSRCALMECWWLRPSAQPDEDTEGRGGGVCVWLHFWNGGWVHKGDRGHPAYKTKVVKREKGWNRWLWRGVKYGGRVPGEEESYGVSKERGIKNRGEGKDVLSTFELRCVCAGELIFHKSHPIT